jgi:signal transduction histidine kinase
MNLLREYIRKLLDDKQNCLRELKLRVFDFDDTLVKSGSRIKVSHKGQEKYITPAEFAMQGEKPGHGYDYSEFLDVVNPREIRRVTNILRNAVRAGTDGREIVILSARGPGSKSSIRDYLESIGIDTTKITFALLGNANPIAKRNWIENRIADRGVTDVLFFDDSGKNINAVSSLKDQFPDIKLITRKVSYAEEI